MNIIQKYIAYLKDNPKKLWFKRKLYGWGWMPCTWQGGAVIFVYVFLISVPIVAIEKDIPGNPDSGSNFLILVLPIIIFTALLIYICYKKGESPRFQWGENKKNTEVDKDTIEK